MNEEFDKEDEKMMKERQKMRVKIGYSVKDEEYDSIQQKNIEEALNNFSEFYEKEDLEKVSHLLEYLGQTSEMINIVKIPEFTSCKILEKLISIFSSSPPLSVVRSILNILTSIIDHIDLQTVNNFFNESFFELIIQMLHGEENEEMDLTKHRIFIFLDNFVLKSKEFRDHVINNMPIQALFDLFNSTEQEGNKVDVLLFFSKAAFWPDFPNTEDLFEFIFSFINDGSLDKIVLGMTILYYLEMNDSSEEKVLIQRINEAIGVNFNKVLNDLAGNKLSEFPLKLLSDIIACRKVNDQVEIMLLINMYLNSEAYEDQSVEITCVSNAINLIISIAKNCEEPFTHEELVLLLSKSREMMRDKPSRLKVKSALLIDAIFPHFTRLEIDRMIEFGILNFISPVLLMCNENELLQILEWVFKLFTTETDPKFVSFMRESIAHSDLSETLDDVAENAEDEGNKEVLDIATKIKLLLDFSFSDDEEHDSYDHSIDEEEEEDDEEED